MSIQTIVEERALAAPDAIALQAPGRPPLTSVALHEHVTQTASILRTRGLTRDDIVAVVVPNGPEMAAAFLSVTLAGICAPLNPAYGRDELEFYLGDLPAKALMISGLPDSPARDVARQMGISIIELAWSDTDPAGVFRIEAPAGDRVPSSTAGLANLDAVPEENDVALVLHTSGTTSRPKIVPLTHANLCSSARHIAETLELTSADRCLNVMPLFHIHGIVGALLSSLQAGGSVVCTPGFAGASFFDWLAAFRPTWYTAVPTMHRAVLSRAAAHSETISTSALRFIRSSSAALPRATLEELEQTFEVPVIEAYGMAEAAHQMASHPLPPFPRKAGTVGRAAGPEITVLDSDGRKLPAGARGEIAIRGPNVTAGYLRNSAANDSAY